MVWKIFFAPNFPLFRKSGLEKKKKRGSYEASCFSSKRKKLTQKYQNVLTKLEIDYLTKFSVSKSNFYGFPKIHKSA